MVRLLQKHLNIYQVRLVLKKQKKLASSIYSGIYFHSNVPSFLYRVFGKKTGTCELLKNVMPHLRHSINLPECKFYIPICESNGIRTLYFIILI